MKATKQQIKEYTPLFWYCLLLIIFASMTPYPVRITLAGVVVWNLYRSKK